MTKLRCYACRYMYCHNLDYIIFKDTKYNTIRIMAQLFILSYSDAVSFRDIRGHLGKIPSIVIFYIYALVVEGDYSRVTRRHPGEYK
jgi:hypothetical protein